MKFRKKHLYVSTAPSCHSAGIWRVGAGILLLMVQFSFAQKKDSKKDENIGTEVVNVVKPYTPTLSEAFKLSEKPILEDEDNTKKELLKYSILSFPVASTFTPSKGKAEGVEKEKQAHLFDNYATFGVGNYATVSAELFVNQDLGNSDYVGGMFRHLSSQGGIKEVELKDSFYDTAIDLTYGVRQSNLAWNLNFGYKNQIYNWYGLPTDFGSSLSVTDRNNLISGINPQHSYNNLYVGGKLDINEGVLKDAMAKFNYISDNFGSAESRFYIKPNFKFAINELAFKTNLIADYVGGSFKKNYSNTASINYGFANFGILPSFAMQREDWSFNLGIGVFYSADFENNKNNIYVYPQINASYKVVGDLMIFYAAAEGNLEQNTYADFVNVNPFLSPTLNVKPTDRQYDISAGLKGKLSATIAYNIRGSFASEKNRTLFKSNDFTESVNNENYAFGNSFQVVYDDMKTIRFYGELKADVSEDLTLAIDGTFNSFTNDKQAEAWNLPAITLNAKANFNITSQWYAGANLFFVGERKDSQIDLDKLPFNGNLVSLKSYFDLNAHLGFKYNERLTAFLKANNIANQNYQRWLNYPVQGFQVVLGANYKFDF